MPFLPRVWLSASDYTSPQGHQPIDVCLLQEATGPRRAGTMSPWFVSVSPGARHKARHIARVQKAFF